MIEQPTWVTTFPGAITIVDANGVIIDLNDKAAAGYAAEGGRALIGRNLLDCHPEPARSKLQTLLREQRSNIYTIEKRGVRKLIHQTPWFKDGQFAGLVELSLELPTDMQHFVRQG